MRKKESDDIEDRYRHVAESGHHHPVAVVDLMAVEHRFHVLESRVHDPHGEVSEVEQDEAKDDQAAGAAWAAGASRLCPPGRMRCIFSGAAAWFSFQSSISEKDVGNDDTQQEQADHPEHRPEALQVFSIPVQPVLPRRKIGELPSGGGLRSTTMPEEATVFFPMDEKSQRKMGWGPERDWDGAEIMFVKACISSANEKPVEGRF